ncbi:MAG: hypothetical protein LBT27_08030, partial [Prevotellaceae bacterium]|nr:hypothetical protein [Prevotellaceae bacterium]
QQDRNFYRFIFFGLLIVGVGGYFCYKKADKELQKRTSDDVNIIASNRKIVFLRTLGLMGIAVFALTTPMCILDENTAVLIVVLYMPLSLAMGPYFIFRKLTNIFSFKFCIAVTISLIIAMIICILLKIPPMLGGTVFGGLPILVLYAKKMSQAAKLLGI